MKSSGEVETFSFFCSQNAPKPFTANVQVIFTFILKKLNLRFCQNLSILLNSSPFVLNKAWIDKLLTISLRQTVILIFSVGIPVLNTYTWCTYIVPWLSSLCPSVGMAYCPPQVWTPALACRCQEITVYTSSLYNNVNVFSAQCLDIVSTQLGGWVLSLCRITFFITRLRQMKCRVEEKRLRKWASWFLRLDLAG